MSLTTKTQKDCEALIPPSAVIREREEKEINYHCSCNKKAIGAPVSFKVKVSKVSVCDGTIEIKASKATN